MSLVSSERAGEIYQSIGQAIVDLLPDDFLIAWANAEIHEEFSSFEVFYKKPSGRIGYLDEGLDGIERGFRDLLRESRDDRWTTATFRLTSEGKMTFDFGYDDVSDFDGAPERRNSWILKYLGDASAIDW